MRETFCEGLKRLCKLFEVNGQNHFEKPVIFSKSSITKHASKKVVKLWNLIKYVDMKLLQKHYTKNEVFH